MSCLTHGQGATLHTVTIQTTQRSLGMGKEQEGKEDGKAWQQVRGRGVHVGQHEGMFGCIHLPRTLAITLAKQSPYLAFVAHAN